MRFDTLQRIFILRVLSTSPLVEDGRAGLPFSQHLTDQMGGKARPGIKFHISSNNFPDL